MLYILIGINCGLLPDIANGKVAIAPDTRLGSTATYSCNAGFNLVGPATRQCQASGQWSGQEPSCERKSLGLNKIAGIYFDYFILQLLTVVLFLTPKMVGPTSVLTLSWEVLSSTDANLDSNSMVKKEGIVRQMDSGAVLLLHVIVSQAPVFVSV